MEEGRLLDQLQTVKDFYLLARGELFLAFIDKANHLLQTPPIQTTEHGEAEFNKRCCEPVSHFGWSFADVNSAFQQAAHNVFLDDDTLLQKLHFQVPFKDKKDDTPKKSKQQLRDNSPWIVTVCIVSYILRRCSESNESRLECSVTRLLSWLANSNPFNTSCNCKVVVWSLY